MAQGTVVAGRGADFITGRRAQMIGHVAEVRGAVE